MYNNDSVVTGKGRRTFSCPGKSTLTSSIKHKYVVRSRHTALCGEKFMPVNKSQAKHDVLKRCVHDDGEAKPDETFQKSMQTIYQTHGSTFKNTNYITQDP